MSSISLLVHKKCNLSFLWDPWCNRQTISASFNSTRLSHRWVKEFISNRHWVLPDYVPAVIKTSILGISIEEEQPVFTWEGSSNPSYRNFMALFYSQYDDVVWSKYIWHKKYALRYACYAWMAVQGKLK
ncbi:hypothetical protein KFK09_021633 [Dendrobium nobile]|uniref:Reverse transcriptase zinc-binding domain-containing protein n=1 Tax=Dendrobium nobile TaxID=94219 RepID=A0A8T3ARQ0_DENNO|nr:hypothetical protein KFK09_021633 [Dendrobium nobile]